MAAVSPIGSERGVWGLHSVSTEALPRSALVCLGAWVAGQFIRHETYEGDQLSVSITVSCRVSSFFVQQSWTWSASSRPNRWNNYRLSNATEGKIRESSQSLETLNKLESHHIELQRSLNRWAFHPIRMKCHKAFHSLIPDSFNCTAWFGTASRLPWFQLRLSKA